MAQNITLLGASYQAVPAVTLPKTGGGTASFTDVTDTTAAAADVASGKYFYTAAGVRTQGTNSGGGGASNYVHGSFTTNSASGAQSVTISYTGSGYPIMATVVVKGGAYSSGTDWYDTVQRYAVGQWTLTKANMNATPTYTTSGAVNYGVTTAVYKNSTSSATSYTRTSSMTANAFSSSNANSTATTNVRFRSSTLMSVFVAGSSYGLLPDTEYEYFIVYSE